MPYTIKYSGSITEPITATQVKEYCKIDYTDEDTLITLLISAVRQQIEEYTGLSLVAKTITYFSNDFETDDEIFLPYPEHSAISSVKVNGTSITDYIKTGLSQFIIRIPSSYGINLNANDYGLEIVYTTSGYCPEAIKIEMLKLLNEKYRNRGNTFEGSIAELSENCYANLAKYCLV